MIRKEKRFLLQKEYREKIFDPEHRQALIEAQRRLDEHMNKYSSPNEVQQINCSFSFRFKSFSCSRNKNSFEKNFKHLSML